MLNKKLDFLLNPRIISDLSNMYGWALKSQREFDQLPDVDKKEIMMYRIDWDYVKTATRLVNARYHDQLVLVGISMLTTNDLERSYNIQHNLKPIDRIGAMHTWITSHLPFYAPNKKGNVQYKLDNYENSDSIVSQLFDWFLKYVDKNQDLPLITRDKLINLDTQAIEITFREVFDIILKYDEVTKELFIKVTNYQPK